MDENYLYEMLRRGKQHLTPKEKKMDRCVGCEREICSCLPDILMMDPDDEDYELQIENARRYCRMVQFADDYENGDYDEQEGN